MHVGFHIHPFAMHVKGGGEVQLLKYRELLSKHQIQAQLHNIWQPDFDTIKIFHHFHLISGGLPMLDYVRGLGIPLVLNTNIWFDKTNLHLVNLNEISSYLSVVDRFIANSNAELKNIEQSINLELPHGRVVYNGVSDVFAIPVDTSVFVNQLPFDERYILTIGNIEPRKNQLRLAKAAKYLNMPLVCIGGVRDYEYLNKCLETHSKFMHIGAVERESPLLRSALQHCHTFVLASDFETPGLAALEAAASQCQVVITGEGSTREYFGEFARYLEPSSTTSIATAIESSFVSPIDPKEIQNHVLTNYNWDNTILNLLNIYDELLQN